MKNLILLASMLIFYGCAMDNAKLDINDSLDASQALSVEKNNPEGEPNDESIYLYNSPSDPSIIDGYDFRPFESEGKWGYKYKEEVVIAPEYSFAGDFIEGYSRVQKNGKMGYIDRQGNVVIDFLYERSSHFYEGLANVQLNNKWGLINTKGEVILPFEYDNIDMFNEGFASVQRNGKRGFINEQFVEVIECQYDEGYDFNEGLANVKLNNKWGFINKKGEVIIPFIYDDADRFRDGESQAIKDDETFLITMSGKRLDTPVTTDYLYQLE